LEDPTAGLEEWNDAEIWYDEYLERDNNASPDEIIRYTEILAKQDLLLKVKGYLKNMSIDTPMIGVYGAGTDILHYGLQNSKLPKKLF